MAVVRRPAGRHGRRRRPVRPLPPARGPRVQAVTAVDPEAVIAATRRWIADVVIGLDLCPFARRVFDAGRIRYAVTAATDAEAVLAALADELAALTAAPQATVETTLLVHPAALTDFPAYLDFLPDADRLVARLGLRGVVQIAGFHPAYRFAGTADGAAENYTNRSPYPMLHLLREASVAEAAA